MQEHRPEPESEFIVEFQRIGGQVRVTAIDPVTHREATIIGAASASPKDLGALAARKLRYVLQKKT